MLSRHAELGSLTCKAQCGLLHPKPRPPPIPAQPHTNLPTPFSQPHGP